MLWSLYRQARLFFDPRSNLRTPVFFAAVSAVGAGAYWWHSVKRKQEDEFLDAHFSRGNTQEKIKTLEQAYQKAPAQISSLLRRRLIDRLLSQTIAQNAWVLRGDAELFPGPYSGLAYSTEIFT